MSLTITNDDTDLLVNNKNLLPTGSIICYAGVQTISGWLLCNGSEVSKSAYANLFSIIGNTYGAPSNSSNFVLPNLCEKVAIGKSPSNNLGDMSGNSSINLSVSQLPSHTHTGTTDASGVHSHTATDSGHSHSYDDAYFAENTSGGTNIYGTNASTDNDNEYIYRTPQPVTSTGTANITVGNNGSHAHTFTTNTTGSGAAINIRNPYIVLNYIIKI